MFAAQFVYRYHPRVIALLHYHNVHGAQF